MSFDNNFDNNDLNNQNSQPENSGTTQSSYSSASYQSTNTPPSSNEENRSNTADYYSRYASYRPVPATEPVKKSGSSNAFKTLAMLLAVAVIGGFSGGGVSYMMLKNIQSPAGVESLYPDTVNSTPMQQPVQDTTDTAPQSTISPTINGGIMDVSDIVEIASVSVVEIQVELTATNPFFGEYSAGGSGSGVIFSEDGYIVTNNHVTDGASKITVRTKDGSEHDAVLIGSDSQTDLAVIKILESGLVPAALGDSDALKVGEVAVAIGNPLGTLGGTVTQGIISAKDREVTIDGSELTQLIQTSAAVNPGNSGGGLFNASGNLVGIVNAKSSGNNIEGLGFAIPVNIAKAVADDLISDGYVKGRPEIGISTIDISTSQDALRARVNDLGVYVASVNRDRNIDLEVADLIVSIEGQAVQTGAELRSVLSKKKAGETIEMVVKRDNNEISVSVTLAEKIPEEIKARMNRSF